MSKNLLSISELMHPFPYTIGIDQSLKVAIDTMSEHNVRHLPVQKGGMLVGVISDRDINFAVAVEKTDPENMTVEDAFTDEPYVVPPETTIDKVARRMAHDHIGCTLVTNGSKLLGIFTTVDACRVLAELASGSYEQ